MKRLHTILLLLLAAIGLQAMPDAHENKEFTFSHVTPQTRIEADSIMRFLIDNAYKYVRAISEYKAEIYIKGRTEIEKKNFLINYANHIFPVEKRKPEVIFEMVTESEYEAPNLYRHNFKAVNGNSLPRKNKQEEILTFLNMNIYSPTIYDETIITPVNRKAFNYYEFNLEEVEEIDEGKVYKIRFIPKQWSQSLVSGDLYIRDEEWRIEKIEMNGRFDFADFSLRMSFGHKHGQLILPNASDLVLRYNILGNVVESTYHSAFNYQHVEWSEIEEQPSGGKRQWKPLDMTQYFTILSDSIPIIRDETYWNSKRDSLLTEEEKEIYRISYAKAPKEKTDSAETENYMDVAEQLVSNVHFDVQSLRFRYSGLLNPLQLGYSSRNGITYKQQLRITKTFDNGQQLMVRPEVGIVFKRRQLFLKLRSEWIYKPEKRGRLFLTIANDNQTYSSQMMQDINEHLKDSLFDFGDLNLRYYNHYYTDLRNEIELANGLEFIAGISYHRRDPVRSKKNVDPGEEVEDIINDSYYDFTPEIGLRYTPRQFYRMNGNKKEYVYSYYPTFSFSFARGIPGILKSSGDYGRIEMDIHQSMKIGSSLKRFSYHLSGGMYTKMKSTYFAEFRYFTRSYFPESWEERIGGVFHTLKREWFNASDKYVQSHLMYESPFILLNLFNKRATRHVLSERLYLGQVWTPALNSYTEIGYGFGNAIFNIGIFAGFNKLEYNRLGLRFTFEIE